MFYEDLKGFSSEKGKKRDSWIFNSVWLGVWIWCLPPLSLLTWAFSKLLTVEKEFVINLLFTQPRDSVEFSRVYLACRINEFLIDASVARPDKLLFGHSRFTRKH